MSVIMIMLWCIRLSDNWMTDGRAHLLGRAVMTKSPLSQIPRELVTLVYSICNMLYVCPCCDSCLSFGSTPWLKCVDGVSWEKIILLHSIRDGSLAIWSFVVSKVHTSMAFLCCWQVCARIYRAFFKFFLVHSEPHSSPRRCYQRSLGWKFNLDLIAAVQRLSCDQGKCAYEFLQGP
jgi:hypothetical protein